MAEDWFEENAPKTKKPMAAAAPAKTISVKTDEDWFEQHKPEPEPPPQPEPSVTEVLASPKTPLLIPGVGDIRPVVELAKGLFTAEQHVGEYTDPKTGGIKHAATGSEPTNIPGFPRLSKAVNIARGVLEGGVVGPEGITAASGLTAIIKASPAAQTAELAAQGAKSVANAVANPKAAIASYMNRARDPVGAAIQAYKPGKNNLQFGKDFERALPYINEAQAESGKPIESLADAQEAVAAAKKRLWGDYQQIAGPQAKRGVDATPVAEAIKKSIPLKLKVQNPEAAKKIEALADTYKGTFTLGELDDMLSTSNAELSTYYAKNPAARRTAAASNTDIAQNLAEAKALRSLIYGQLDGAGDAARQIKQTYGALTNVEKEGFGRLNVAARQNPDSLSEQMSRWQGAMQIGRAAVTFPSRPLGAMGDIASAAAGRSMASIIKEANTSDALVANIFRNYKGLPVRSVPQMFQPVGLLEAGAHQMPPVPDASFVRGVPAQPAVSGTPRLLPPGPIQMPPSPDTSFVKGVPGQFAESIPLSKLGRGRLSLPPYRAPIITPPPADTSFVKGVPAEFAKPMTLKDLLDLGPKK